MTWYRIPNSSKTYVGDKVDPSHVQIPDRASPFHRWNSGLNDWEEYHDPNWSGLYQALRNSSIYTRSYAAAKGNVGMTLAQNNNRAQVSQAFGSIQAKLLANRWIRISEFENSGEVADLQFLISELRTALQASTPANDFSASEIEYINQALTDNYFPFQLS